MKTPVFSFLIPFSILAVSSSDAALTWTGAGDGISLYQEANWLEDDGSALEANEINGNVEITADTGGSIEITGGIGSPSNFSGNFIIGASNTLTVGGGKILATSVSGIRADGVDGPTPVTTALITGGSTVRMTFSAEIAWTLDGGSTIRFNGDGNPLNGTTIDVLDFASIIIMDDEEYDGAGNFAADHQSKVTFQGNALVFGADPFAIEPGDNALATASNLDGDGVPGVQISFVPEPSSALLGLIGSLLLFRRRR